MVPGNAGSNDMSPKAKQAGRSASGTSPSGDLGPRRPLGNVDGWVTRRGFLAGCILLILLHVGIMAQDINRPFYGLHSWAAASGAWAARVHVKYGWDYTGGVTTWAVGDPPPANPGRYMDHPQLAVNLKAAFFLLTGPSEWANRLYGIIWSAAGLVAILAVFHGLLGRTRALLAGLFMVLFPITGYFGTGGPLTALAFLAIYSYLVIIRGMPHSPQPGKRHWVGLILGLFFMLQWHWGGVFYALTIGMHYVGVRVRQSEKHRNILAVLVVGLWILGPILLFAHGTSYWWFVYPISFGVGIAWLIAHRRIPDWRVPLTVVLTPLASLATNLTILLSGYQWDVTKLVELYKWRSAKGEMPEFRWAAWFHKLGEHALSNFTLSALIVGCSFFVVGLVLLAIRTQLRRGASADSRAANGAAGRFLDRFAMFPGWMLLLMPALLQLFVLRGALWMHQSWERPLAPVLAICCAMGVLLFRRIGATASQRYPNVAGGVFALALTLFLSYQCWVGTRHYYGIRWQNPQKIEALKWLNENIPADKPLLSVDSFMTNQHSSKGAFLRPEIAWYLDRRVVQPISTEEIAGVFQRSPGETPQQRLREAADAIVQSARKAHQETGAPFLLMYGDPDAVLRQQSKANLFDFLAHFVASELPVAKSYPSHPGRRGGPDEPFQAGMRPWIVFDLRGDANQTTQPGSRR